MLPHRNIHKFTWTSRDGKTHNQTEVGGDTFLRNVGSHKIYTAPHPRRRHSSNQNLIQEEIKRRLNSGNVCYHSVQNLSSSRLQYKNVKIRIYKAIIFPVVLCGCEIWSLTLREEQRLREFENRVLRRIFGPKTDEVTAGGENCITRNWYSPPCIIRMIMSIREEGQGM
jgi:hypothetical protein